MSRTALNNGISGLAFRTALNTMFTEIYGSVAVAPRRPLRIVGLGDSNGAYAQM